MPHIIHNVPGRLRIKIPGLKNNPGVGLKLRNRLSDLDHISSVSTRTATGSVLIYYNSDNLQAKEIIAFLKNNGYFKGSAKSANPLSCTRPAIPVHQKIEEMVLGFALEGILTALLRPLGCHLSSFHKILPGLH